MSTNAYSSQSISGYNASPPPDDGSETSANKLEWAKGKTKLADPIKTLTESVNTAVSSAFAKGVNTDASVRNQISGSLALEWATATIDTDAITPDASAVFVGTEAGATSDTLQTIVTTDTYNGALLRLRARNATEEIIIVHATSTAATATGANIYLSGDADITLDNTERFIEFQRDDNINGGWVQTGRNVASQSLMENGVDLDTAVSPGRQHFHPLHAKAGLSFDGTAIDGAADLTGVNSSENITSVVDNGLGSYSVAFDTDFSNANWWCAMNVSQLVTDVGDRRSAVVDKLAGSCRIDVESAAAAQADASIVDVVFFGDHA